MIVAMIYANGCATNGVTYHSKDHEETVVA